MPLGDLSAFLRCSYGTTGFALEDYSYSETPIIGALGLGLSGRRGSDIVVKGRGYITGTDAGSFNDNLWELKHQLSTSGQDFRIYGLDVDPEVSILAARCIDLGPHVTYEIAEGTQGAMFMRYVTFEVRAQTARSNSGSGGKEDGGAGDDTTTTTEDNQNFDLSTSTSVDGLRTITQTGEVRGPNVIARFTGGIFTGFARTYAPGRWALTNKYDVNTQRDLLKYTMTAAEKADPLPEDGFDTAVDGSGSYTYAVDEQQRLVETWQFDLVVRGSALLVYTAARATLPQDITILHESVEIGKYSQHTLKATIVALRSGSGSELMNWSQSFKQVGDHDTWEEKQYPGLDPLAVKRPKSFKKLVQTGSAIGYGIYPVPPPPMFPELLLESPELVFTDLNAAEKRVDWSYTMIVEVFPRILPTRPD